jgi:hypothetical protein
MCHFSQSVSLSDTLHQTSVVAAAAAQPIDGVPITDIMAL